jgi:hypothetical protein
LYKTKRGEEKSNEGRNEMSEKENHEEFGQPCNGIELAPCFECEGGEDEDIEHLECWLNKQPDKYANEIRKSLGLKKKESQ